MNNTMKIVLLSSLITVSAPSQASWFSTTSIDTNCVSSDDCTTTVKKNSQAYTFENTKFAKFLDKKQYIIIQQNERDVFYKWPSQSTNNEFIKLRDAEELGMYSERALNEYNKLTDQEIEVAQTQQTRKVEKDTHNQEETTSEKKLGFFEKFFGQSSSGSSASCDYNQVRDEVEAIIKRNVRSGSGCGVSLPVRAAMYPVEGRGVGEPILDIRSTDKERVASSQKIVTAYLLYKNRRKINYPIRVDSYGAKRVGTSGENKSNWNNRVVNRNLSERDFFQTILGLSSNGASYRAMELITGSTKESSHANFINNFIDDILPGNNTRFTNAHGLDNYSYAGGVQSNFSTPRDMAKITAYIYSDSSYMSFLRSHGLGSGKAGITCRGGRNMALYLRKSSGNCKGQEFSIFYSGKTYGNADKEIYRNFGYNVK